LEKTLILVFVYYLLGNGHGEPHRAAGRTHQEQGCFQAKGGLLRRGRRILERRFLAGLQHHRANGIIGIGGEETEEKAVIGMSIIFSFYPLNVNHC